MEVTLSIERAYQVAATVSDPEMPMLTLADLGVLRNVSRDTDGTVVVALTPTYSGCPAMAAMRSDVYRTLSRAGFTQVDVRTVLSPPWSSAWITAEGRRKLSDSGIAPPVGIRPAISGPIPLTLIPLQTAVPCPRCQSSDTERTSEFGPTACTSLRRCRACLEPFEHVKDH